MTPRRVSPAAARAEIVEAVSGIDGAWIGVDGGTGAGKSVFASELAADLPAAAVIAIDDFAGPLIAEWDWDRFRAQVVVPHRAGRPARYERIDWASGRRVGWRDVPVGAPVIVEGVSATRREAGVEWTLQVWIDTPLETRIRRVLERGGPADLSARLDDWLRHEAAYVGREQPAERVDLIVSGDGVASGIWDNRAR